MRHHTNPNALRVVAPRSAWPRTFRFNVDGRAWYLPDQNTFLLDDFNYGDPALGLPADDDNTSLVHECTHCMIDLYKQHVRSVANESAAYLAAAVYMRTKNLTTTRGAGHPEKVAEEIADRITPSPGPSSRGVIIGPNDVRALNTAVASQPLYKSLRVTLEVFERGDGVPF